MTKLNKTLLAMTTLLVASGANAAAFQLAEVSTSGLGRAYAGEAAIADNASVVATNPALMSLFKANQFSVGGVYVDSKINMNGDVNVTSPLAMNQHNPKGLLASGSASHRSIVPGSLVPNMYFVAPINEKFALGGGMNVNFGLKSEYDNKYNGGVFGGTTDLTALNLNLSGSYRVTEGFSAGLGLNAIYAQAKIERRAGIISDAVSRVGTAIDMGLINIPPKYAPDVVALRHSITSKDKILTQLQDKAAWAFAWNAGVMYQFNENHRIGLAYHSKVDIDFTDRTATSLQARRIGQEGGLKLNLPDYLEFSGFHQLTEKFAMHYSYKYSHWSRLKNLYASYHADGKEAFHKKMYYRNSSRVALGGTYNVDDKLTLRAGIAYDQAAATEHASAAIPDTNRMWYSLGATYKFTPNLSVDLGYAYLKGKKVKFTEKQTVAGLATVTANYTSKASANLYGLNLNYSF
ncbi:MAG: OmpP1/FadL family transporter [Haemophilus parainfluenzae]|uniref:OmpP1/FadL family transporter n=1 Tax=uncultured Haemophilus sp. TaxID=237779 RepID=UPI0028040F31|nr:OmpP1/FadL family transporter [uncultured Haemophilus sp.]MDU4565257.1 OmpP1/FadL family transporter [Haemophilus parainfluenzae]MDU4638099.1 OmpP1/FadL family transporter [Haemophilus parainfluenzae]MDU5008896.1 OmpP1/FadL family transporter [Haemophilus parainfluenzae]MDU5989818.1 OmpP1/FadL family transporter [Haemophilus parainfluenzae]MDU7968754.1 OmpP1/FadL family transporter [Haemophilus parainfluenzae]